MTTGHLRILTISIACALCACFVDSASARLQAAPTYYFCHSYPTADTAYFSGVFVVDYSIDGDARAWTAAGERERRDRNSPSPGPAPWIQQFDQVVAAQTYPRTAKGAGACNSYGTLAETQKRLDETIQYEQNNKYNNKFKVVQTGWKYTPAAGAPSAIGAAAGQASTAAASAPTAASGTAATQRKIYFCTNQVVLDQQNRKYKEFWSDAFASDAEQAVLTSAWRVYLAATYQLNPNDGRQINGGCGDGTTAQFTEWKANAKQSWERKTKILQDRVAAGSPGIVEEHTVVDTGWKYTPNPNAAPSAPTASRPVDPCVFTGVGLATAPPAGCRAPVISYAVCYSANNQSTVYLSSAFAVTDAASTSWINGFTQFLAQKYSYQGGGVGCNNMTLNIAQTSLKNRIAALRANKKQVVETGWTFNSVPAVAVEPVPAPAPVSAAPAAAPVVPAAPTTLYAVCWDATLGIRDLTAYFGVPFAVTARNNQVWATAFKSYLNDKYGSTSAGNVSCNVSQSLAQAQQTAQQWKDRYSANRKIVETGWKYQ